MAEIFMQNIPLSVNHVEIVRSLADILHNPPFFDADNGDFEQLTNFHVALHRGKNLRPGNKHNGNGSLTLPDPSIASLFLQYYGPLSFNRRPLRCENNRRVIRFKASRHRPRQEVIALIQSTPYLDPKAQEAREERANQLRAVVRITDVQFGWQCRDDTFSIEWRPELRSSMASPPSLAFQEETSELWVSLGGSNQPLSEDEDVGVLVSMVVVSKFSRVESLAYDTSSGPRPAVLFTFPSAPAFELHRATSVAGSSYPPAANIIPRSRLTSFSPSHEKVAPYTSLAMRIVCASRGDFTEFKRMAGVANFPTAIELPPPPPSRQLFAESALERIHRWIARLPFVVGFQALAILNNLRLDPAELWELRPQIMSLLNQHKEARTSEILRLFGPYLQMLGWEIDSFNSDEDPPRTIQDCLRRATKDATPLHMALRNQSKNPGWFNCHHVTITPTRMVLDGPYPDQSNRVLRRFPNHHDYFLRVNFADEELLDYRWDRDVDGAGFVRDRVGGVLKSGLDVGGRRFEFLAYSSSALKEHAVWFCAPFTDAEGVNWNADAIRKSLGNFSHLERYPARYGARMSQAFTATEPGIILPLEEINMTNDIERNGSNFTDGIGDISKDLARQISKKLQRRPGSKKRFYIDPSAYQFRMDGYKGMIAVNHRLERFDIKLRKSQKKFDGESSPLIFFAQSFYRPKPVYLNRYMIMILETLGVSTSVFVKLQDDAVKEVEAATQTLATCAKFLDAHGIGTSYRLSSVMLQLHKLKVGLQSETHAFLNLNDPFLDRAIEFAANHVLRVMKHKARIPVKGSYTLVGVVDVHGWLKPNEVFVCIQNRDEKPWYIRGKVLVTRSPQVHPGDVQFVEAIGSPPPKSPFAVEMFPNCVVFSSLGDRCIPSMLAGGDLDGDEYNVILNPDLFPKEEIHPPAEYPPASIKDLGRPCTINDLADWVAEYINTDILGFVADQFLQLADQSPLIARDPDCIKLAELASKAVDFAKSGTPVSRDMIPKLRFPSYQRPDWSAGEVGTGRNGRLVYRSNRAIGHLFRRIDLNDAERLAARQARRQRAGAGHNAEQRAEAKLERAMKNLVITGPARNVLQHPISLVLLPVLERHIDAASTIPENITTVARRQFDAYVSELRFIATCNTITWDPLTEEEILMGTITAKTSQPRKRVSMMARLRNQTDELVKRIRAELAGELTDTSDSESDDENEDDLEDWLLRSWAAWQVSVLRDKTFGGKSFGFVALRSIFECLKAIEDRDERMSYVA
ncbi:hypothetical protein FRB90_007566 [Tulasnella sp. 427]|nr:hypothetical protein FRB90_007566 [Tulasnella sp. 427]